MRMFPLEIRARFRQESQNAPGILRWARQMRMFPLEIRARFRQESQNAPGIGSTP